MFTKKEKKMDRERQKKVLYTKYLLRMVYNDNNNINNNNEQQVYTITATYFTGSIFHNVLLIYYLLGGSLYNLVICHGMLNHLIDMSLVSITIQLLELFCLYHSQERNGWNCHSSGSSSSWQCNSRGSMHFAMFSTEKRP